MKPERVHVPFHALAATITFSTPAEAQKWARELSSQEPHRIRIRGSQVWLDFASTTASKH